MHYRIKVFKSARKVYSGVDTLWCRNIRVKLNNLKNKIMNDDESVELMLSDASGILTQVEERLSKTCAPSKPSLQKLANAIGQLGNELYLQFMKKQETQCLDLVIRCEAEVVRVTIRLGDDEVRADRLYNLGISYLARFECLGKQEDIAKAIECNAQAVLLTPDGHADMPSRLNNLGNTHQRRFEQTGDSEDIDKVIECHTRAVSLAHEGHPDMHGIFHNLGNAYDNRFELLGDPGDIDQAIKYNARAVSLVPQGHTYKFIWLNNLGLTHIRRFQLLGELEDLNKAIDYNAQAVSLIPEGDAMMPAMLNNLGKTHWSRFQRLGELEDIDKAIEFYTQAVSLTPEDNVDPQMFHNLGDAHQIRFELLSEPKDIDKAIECYARAVSLTPEDDEHLPSMLNNLGLTFKGRFERLGLLEDIDKAIGFETKAVSLTLDGHENMPSILCNLGSAHQSRFERVGSLEDLDKAIKCKAQAVYLTPNDHEDMPSRLNSLGNAYQSRFELFGEPGDIDKAIDLNSRAVSLTPEGHADMPLLLNNLGIAHQCRFGQLGKLEDIDKAIALSAQAVLLTPDGHADRANWLGSLGNAHHIRYERLDKPDDINKAIDYKSQAVLLTPKDHAAMPGRLNNLGNAHQSRFKRLGDLEDLNKAIEMNAHAVSLTPKGYAHMPGRLNNLGAAYHQRFELLSKLEDIDKAIDCYTQAASFIPAGHVDMPMRLNNLGMAHRSRFELLGELEDIEKTIKCGAEAASLTPEGHAEKSKWLYNLGIAYKMRHKRIGDHYSTTCSLESFRKAALSLHGDPRLKFAAAREWAEIASLQELPEHLEAFQTAMRLVPHLIWLGETISQRYHDIPSIDNVARAAAAAAISTKRYDMALEWLEQGRSIVWNQILQLRNPLDDISTVNPRLAHTLQLVANELHNAGSQSLSDANSLEKASQRHRRVAERYDELVQEVRRTPGFENFLQPKTASELVGAARTGPVAIINVHNSRCDALILIPHQTEIAHVPLPNLTHDKAAKARTQLEHSLRRYSMRARHVGVLQRKPQEDALEHVLATLWTDVAKPVLDLLVCTQDLQAENLPHITWCATGPMSFLPLHAAGCFHTPGAKVFDFAISSYTPTLSALLAAPPFSDIHSKVLAVGQEATPNHSPLPGTKTELACIKGHVTAPFCYTQLDGSNATTAAVLAAMEQQDWVHLACHANQNVKDPTESGFFLHDGMLSLATITQKSFKNKGLAFLSACQTAKGDANLPDEAVHLASGMWMAGYPSVIATMWSVKDADAPVIADKVYGELLKDGRMDYRNAAKALHMAVNHLRAEVGEKEFVRWVPYIHIGI